DVLGGAVLIAGDQGRIGVVSSPADEVRRIRAIERVEVVPDLFGDPSRVGAVGRFAFRFVGGLPVPVQVRGAARGILDVLGRHLRRGVFAIGFAFLELLGLAFWVRLRFRILSRFFLLFLELSEGLRVDRAGF